RRHLVYQPSDCIRLLPGGRRRTPGGFRRLPRGPLRRGPSFGRRACLPGPLVAQPAKLLVRDLSLFVLVVVTDGHAPVRPNILDVVERPDEEAVRKVCTGSA